MPYKDIQKRRECHKRYYLKNKKNYILKNKRRRKGLIDFVINFKQNPCMDCGVKYPHYVMDFDHRDANSEIATINAMINFHSYSKEKILKEIEKCDLVCANCHRMRTHKKIIAE
jgi:hypothetical protein